MMLLRVVLLLLGGAKFMLQEELTLSPAFQTALENTSVELTCNAPVGTNSTQWGTFNRPTIISYLTFSKDESCSTDGFLSDTKYFETECYSNGTFKIRITQVNLNHHGQNWYCLNNHTISNTAEIYVQVPVKYVELGNVSGNVLNLIENISSTLTCLTSEGRPSSNITWTKISKTDIYIDLTHDATAEISSKKNLTIVKSSIQLVPKRKDNNSLIICRAKNGNFTGVEKNTTLYVQYPPNKPMFFVNERQANGTVQLMLGSNVSILCKSDSYPLPTYHWNSAGRSEVGPYLHLSSLFKNETWQCTSTNNMKLPNGKTINGTSSSIINIFYSIEILFYVIGKEHGNNVEVIENEVVIFNCSVNSIPKSEIVIYFAEKELRRNKYTHTLEKSLRVTSCLDDGVYICEAKNQYNSQPSTKELGLSVKCTPLLSPEFDLTTDVTCPQNVTITLQFKALANPTPQFHWFKLIGSSWMVLDNGRKYKTHKADKYSNLIIRGITSKDYGIYKLRIQNEIGTLEQLYLLKPDDSRQRLHFMITKMAVEGNKFIVNTHEDILFMCSSGTDLPFDIIIKRQDGIQLALMKNTTSVRHKIQTVSCNDAGIYICSAKEPRLSQTQSAISKLTLIVKCPPAPATRYKGDETILSVLHSEVTLQFEVLGFFDEIINTVFMWYKQNISLPNDGRKYIITSYGFQSNLIIRNIAVTDFGQYKVAVSNSYGHYIYHFELKEKVSQVEKSIFESTTTRILLVAVGTFGFIIVVGVVIAIRFCQTRRRRSESFQMGQIEMSPAAVANQITSIEDNNVDDAHYHEIIVYEHLDQRLKEREEYVEMQSIKSEDSNKYYITPIHLDQQLTEREDYIEMQSIKSEDSNKYYITPIHVDQQLTEGEEYIEMQSINSENSNKYYITPTHH